MATTTAPSAKQSATVILDRQFLEMRCQLLDLAAAFDRLERAPAFDQLTPDDRLRLLQEAVAILASPGANRAERLQLLFSDQYTPGWNRRGGE